MLAKQGKFNPVEDGPALKRLNQEFKPNILGKRSREELS